MGWSIPQAPVRHPPTPWSPWVCLLIIGIWLLLALVWIVFRAPATGLPPLASGFYLPLTGFTAVGSLLCLATYLLSKEMQALRYFNWMHWQANTDTAWQRWAQQHLCRVGSVILTPDKELVSRMAGIAEYSQDESEDNPPQQTLFPDENVVPGSTRIERVCRELLEQAKPMLAKLSYQGAISVYLQTTSEFSELEQSRFRQLWQQLSLPRALDLQVLPPELPFATWNDRVLSSQRPVLLLAFHARQPEETLPEIATALLLAPPELIDPKERAYATRFFRAMPVKATQLTRELQALRDIAQQAPDSLRLVCFSGLSDALRQTLTAAVNDLQLPLRREAPQGGLLDFDKGSAPYGALASWLMLGAAAQWVEYGQGDQWLLAGSGEALWALSISNQPPVLTPPPDTLPTPPWPWGCLALTLCFTVSLFWLLGVYFPDGIFSLWGMLAMVLTYLLGVSVSAWGVRYWISQTLMPRFIQTARAD